MPKFRMFFYKCSFIFLFFIINASCLIAKNIEPDSNKLRTYKESIDLYYHSFDTSAFAGILTNLESDLLNHSQSYYLNYYAGILKMILGKIYYNINSKYAYELFTKSVEHFHSAEKINRTAEIAALLSAGYGKRSSLAGLNAIFLGIKAKNWIYDAAEIDKRNPKINLVAATHLMHLPSFYGGDKPKARRLLNDIFKMKDLKNNDEFSVNWADEAETYAYLAQLAILENNREEATKFMQEALKLKPKYGFVLYDLQKQLEKIKP